MPVRAGFAAAKEDNGWRTKDGTGGFSRAHKKSSQKHPRARSGIPDGIARAEALRYAAMAEVARRKRLIGKPVRAAQAGGLL